MQSTSEEFVKSLGEGAYGFVGLVKYTDSNGSSFHAAVKTSDVDDYESLNKEFQILSELSGYPNIVQCFSDDVDLGLTDKGYFLCQLLLEYASHGSLTNFMDRYTDRKLPEPMIRDFTRMILQGLVSIHGRGYVHCDLKPDNLLVFPSGDSYELKITDFGNSLKVGQVPDYWETDYPFVGTPVYMPPESFHDGVAEKTLDLWSLGCIVLQMYTGQEPWDEVQNEKYLVPLLLDGKAPEIPESVPCDAREFIETCFARNSVERGSACELLCHRFLRQEEEEKKIIALSLDAQETRDSLLLNLKLRIRRALKISKDISVKNVFLSKPKQFQKVWNTTSASSLVSVQ